jgi:cytochrome c-type biogenesis protein CcmH
MESGNQTQAGTPKAALYALVGAAAILIVAVVYGATRGTAAPKPDPTPTAAVAQQAVTVEALQDAVKATPNDPKAWAALGEAHFARDEYPETVTALEKAVSLDPNGPGYWSALGEARIYASASDPMPVAAVDAFRKAVALDPKDPRARYFLAVKRDLGGDHAGAIRDWLALLAEAPPGAVWEPNLRQTIVQSGKKYGIEVDSRMAKIRPVPTTPAAPMPGPNADQIQAASQLSPAQQDEMARGMVSKLEAKLQADPSNLEGWVMLMRSRVMLNEPARATAALKAAVAANPGAKAELEAQARGLGITSP